MPHIDEKDKKRLREMLKRKPGLKVMPNHMKLRSNAARVFWDSSRLGTFRLTDYYNRIREEV